MFEATQKIEFSPVQFAKTAARLANEANLKLKREIMVRDIALSVMSIIILVLI